MVLKDPEPQKERGTPCITSSGSASEGEGDGTPSPSGNRGREDVREEPPKHQMYCIRARDLKSYRL
jgi:hypothetical protein